MINDGQKMTRKRGRPNAFRSCKGCRDQKKRCELKESVLLISPSSDPLREDEACSRCFILGLPCILDDFEKIEKIASKRRKSGLQQQQQQQQMSTIPSSHQSSINHQSIDSYHHISSSSPSSGPPMFPTDLQEFKRYTPRSRPITLVSEISLRQPNFAIQSFRIAQEWEKVTLSVYELVDDTLALDLSNWCESHLLIWLPGLPVPNQIHKSRLLGQPLSAPLKLLEVAQYAIAVQHSSKTFYNAPLLITSLTRKVESLLSLCILSSQKDLHSAQAMELLAVFPIASAYFTPSDHGRKRSLEMTSLTSDANRIASICRNEYRSIQEQTEQHKRPSTMNARQFELGLQWCSSTAWDFSQCVGSDDLIQVYGHRYTPNLNLDEVSDLLQYVRSNPATGSKGLGQMFVLLRAHLVAGVIEAWVKLNEESPFGLSKIRRMPERSIQERLKILGGILNGLEERCAQSKALRYSWLESNRMDEAKVILNWLDLEELAFFLMISARTLFFALQEDENAESVLQFTPDYLYKMINQEASNEFIRKFIFHHGDYRIDAAESILMIASSLSSFSFSNRNDLIVPTLTTCGYIMEACMLGMEVHGTNARYWHSLPRKSMSWQNGMNGCINLLERIKDVPEEEGGITSTIERIIAGMIEVIGIWRRAITRTMISQHELQHQTPNVDQNNNQTNSHQNNNHDDDQNSQDRVGGIDVSIPPLATDEGEVLSLDQLLRDLFGSTDWLDVLPSVEGRRSGVGVGVGVGEGNGNSESMRHVNS